MDISISNNELCVLEQLFTEICFCHGNLLLGLFYRPHSLSLMAQYFDWAVVTSSKSKAGMCWEFGDKEWYRDQKCLGLLTEVDSDLEETILLAKVWHRKIRGVAYIVCLEKIYIETTAATYWTHVLPKPFLTTDKIFPQMGQGSHLQYPLLSFISCSEEEVFHLLRSLPRRTAITSPPAC